MADLEPLCIRYTAQINSHFAKIFNKHSFDLVGCFCEHGGRECRAFYQSSASRLTLEFSDGEFTVLVGSLDTKFIEASAIDRFGATGWYPVFLLAEFKNGKQVYTEKLVQQIENGKTDQYRHEAELFDRWADQLLPMFAAGQESSWRAHFRRYYDRPKS